MSFNLFNRKYSLIIGDPGTTGLQIDSESINALRIVFDIKKNSQEAPNDSTISVYNLSKITIDKIQKEKLSIILNAGYKGLFGNIYSGRIRYISKKREDTDIATVIECGDGDHFYNSHTINQTIEAGSTDQTILTQLMTGAQDTILGFTKGLNTNQRPRPRVLSGNARDYVREIANSNNLQWSIQDGQLQMLGANDVLAGFDTNNAIELNAATGLIGLPEQTEIGIKVKSLINPMFRVNGTIHIDNSMIIRDNKKGFYGTLDKDGFYKIISINYQGDYRGNDWYSILEGAAING